ncbi:MAG: PIG-L family deacetylase [bacterium]|nr:PIG-L family deacetylase [bacterium]
MNQKFDPRNKKFLAVSAHPDDADFYAGGTMLSWLASGAKGSIVIATNGDKGSSDKNLTSEKLAETRKKEQLSASSVLGLEQTWFLDFPDAHLEITQDLKAKLVKIIREYKPDAIFTFDPSDFYSVQLGQINHPDHRAIGQAALDAAFPQARDFLTFPTEGQQGLQPHSVTDFFLYNSDLEKNNFFVDINSFFEKKLDLLKLHKSQVDMQEAKAELEKLNSQAGEKIEAKLAEGFVHVQLSS